jgi:Peptidase inhibitor I78 family
MMRALFLVAATMLAAGCIPKSDTETASGSTQASNGTAPEDDAPTLDIAGGCKADGLQRHVGKVFSAALAEQMKKEAGAQTLRTAHENGMITMDFNSGRLNIFYNDANSIVRVDCG